MIKNSLFLLLFVLATTFKLVSFKIIQEKDNITGTWISKKDHKSKWIFTSDSKTKKYYDNKLLSIYTYKIHSSLPECEVEWQNPNPNLKFLVLEKSSGKKDCYVIYNLDEENLTLSPLGSGKFLTFGKQ